MWLFKNLQLYRLPAPWNISLADLEEQLKKSSFHPCGNQDYLSRGWVPPRNESMVYSVGGQWLLSLMEEKRLLPPAIINQEVAERAEKKALEQGYPLGRKAMRELKDQVIEELLPKAFRKRSNIFLWIDPKNGWLGVNTPSQLKAEEVLVFLRKTLSELPLELIRTRRSYVAAMTDWLASGEAPNGFTLDRDSELKSNSEEKAAVRYTRHSLEGTEIKAHLEAGKLPTRLALTWDDRISFILTEKGEIKRLEFLDILTESVDQGAENAEEIFDSSFSIMTGELDRFFQALLNSLGGELPSEDLK